MVAAVLIGAPAVAWVGNCGVAGCGLGALDGAAQPELFELIQGQHEKLFTQDARTKTGLERVETVVRTNETLQASCCCT
jgi:hypothetical protein